MLEHILSGEETEVVVERIHEYLNTIGQNVRNGTIGLDDFVIFKVSVASTIAFSSKLNLRFTETR